MNSANRIYFCRKASSHSREVMYTYSRHVSFFFAHLSYCIPANSHASCARVSRTKDIDLTHQGQFLTPDSQLRTSCSKKLHFISDLFCIISLLLIAIAKAFKGRRNIAGHFRQRSEIFGSGSDVFGNPGHDETKILRV